MTNILNPESVQVRDVILLPRGIASPMPLERFPNPSLRRRFEKGFRHCSPCIWAVSSPRSGSEFLLSEPIDVSGDMLSGWSQYRGRRWIAGSEEDEGCMFQYMVRPGTPGNESIDCGKNGIVVLPVKALKQSTILAIGGDHCSRVFPR